MPADPTHEESAAMRVRLSPSDALRTVAHLYPHHWASACLAGAEALEQLAECRARVLALESRMTSGQIDEANQVLQFGVCGAPWREYTCALPVGHISRVHSSAGCTAGWSGVAALDAVLPPLTPGDDDAR